MARTFDGHNYLLQNVAVAALAPMTFACWFKPLSLGTDATLLAVASSTAGHNSFFSVVVQAADKKARCGISNDAGSATDFSAASTTQLQVGVWYHIACVFLSRANRVCYVNGTNPGSSIVAVTPSTCDSSYIGAAIVNGVLVSGAVGSIAFPAIWNAALGPFDVAALASIIGPYHVQAAALAAYARLTGGHNPEPDLKGGAWTVVNG